MHTMKQKMSKKILSVILTLNLLLQSFVPFLVSPVYADDPTPSASTVDVTPSSTPDVTNTSTPTIEVTPTVEPTPEITIAPTPIITSEATSSPTIEVTPTLEVTPTTTLEVAPEPSSNTSSQAPPQNNESSDSVIPGSDQESIQVSPTDTSLQSVSNPAPLPNTLTIASNLEQTLTPEPTLTTDKPDYFPTDIAYISGAGFLPNTTYTLHIMSSDMPYVSYKVEVTSDENGNLFYAYQLDGHYRPNYSIDALDASGTVITSMIFTDGDHTKDLSITCENVSISGSTWTFSGSWHAYYFPGQSSQYDAELLSPNSSTMIDDSSKDNPDTFVLNQTDKDHISGTWSNQYDFSTAPSAVLASLYHAQNAGAEKSVESTCTFSLPGSISGQKFNDLNGNGIKNTGEAGMSGWTIYLDTNNNSTLDSGETSATTDSTGNYSFSNLTVGTYRVREVLQSGWQQKLPGSGSAYKYDVTLTSGQNVTGKNFGNQRQQGTITLSKEVTLDNGGTAGVNDFGLTIGGVAVNSGETKTLSSGATYAIDEAGLTGYSFVRITGDAKCPSVLGGTISLSPGDDISCTIINDDIAPSLTLVKEVNNDNGGTATTTDWILTATGLDQTTISGEGGATSDSAFKTGTYSLTESAGPSGYTAGDWSCDGGTQVGNTVKLDNGQSSTCTIINSSQKGKIKIVKNTLGGNDNFGFTLTGDTSLTPSITTVDGSGNSGELDIKAGSYSLSENEKSGWKLTDSSCDSGTPESFDVAPGATVTCTFTNTKYSSISGFKYEDGLTDPLSGWVISLYKDTDTLVGTQTTTASGYSFNSLLPGNYFLTEDLISGWTQTDAPSPITLSAGTDVVDQNFTNFQNVSVTACKVEDEDGSTNTDFDQSPVAGWVMYLLTDGVRGTVQTTRDNGCHTWTNLDPNHTYGVEESTETAWTPLEDTSIDFGKATSGSTYSHTFVNFKKAKIIVHKDVVGTDGTIDVLDNTKFKTYLNDGNEQSITESLDVTYSDLAPGTYTVTEGTEPSGYSLVSISDDSGDLDDGVVTVTSGDTFNVYLKNQQNSAHLTVIKKVEGGDKEASDFTLYITGQHVSNTDVSGNEDGTTVTLDAGGYSVDERDGEYDGYTKSLSEDCSGDINFGDTKTCTVTNTRDTGSITIIKDASPDSEDSFRFTGNLGEFTLTDSGEDDSQNEKVFSGLETGNYNITEPSVKGWSLDQITCNTEEGINTNNRNVVIDLSKGEEVICTFHNSKLNTITAHKFDDSNANQIQNDGEKSLSGWNMTLYSGSDCDGESISSGATNASGNISFDELHSGNYSVKETLQEGWNNSTPICQNVTLTRRQGEQVNFGNYSNPEITIRKSNDAGSEKNPGDAVTYRIRLHISGSNVNDLKVRDLLPKGFKYRTGSAKVNGVTLDSLHEPIYASPGKWNLGSFSNGDDIELEYIADISSDQQPGSYLDIVWAQGTSLADSRVLAFADDTSMVDTNFAGTSVKVVKDQTGSDDYNVEKKVEGQVLGASTDLPATGANELWLLGALLSLYVGLKLVRNSK